MSDSDEISVEVPDSGSGISEADSDIATQSDITPGTSRELSSKGSLTDIETDASSGAEVPETDDDDDEQINRPQHRANRISSSEESSDEEDALRQSIYKAESEEEEPIEEQAYSKATRRSIHGVLPRKSQMPQEIDSSDDDSNDIITELSDDDDNKESVKPMLSSTLNARSPMKDISNESFDNSIKIKMSSTVSPPYKEDSHLLDEASGGEKIGVSPAQYAEAVSTLGVLEQQKKNIIRLIETSMLPDGGAKLKIKLNSLLSEISEKQQLIKMMEVDENKSIKNEIARSFQDSQTISIDDSVELLKALDLKDVIPVGNIGVKKFTAQKALTIEKLEEICGSIADRPPEDSYAKAPKHLKITLMKYQLHGVKFMMWRETSNPRGGILADDMGLGKTLTTLSLVLKGIQRAEEEGEESESDSEDDEKDDGWKTRGRKDFRRGGTLIICPASLLKQWEYEIKTKVKKGAIEFNVFHGPNREYKASRLAKFDVVLSTYQIVVSEEKSNGCLFQIKWNRIVLDEGHVIRNHKSKQSEAICKLPAKNRWVLSGTPIHNKEFDIYAAIKFLRCRPFSDLLYWKRYIEINSGKESSPRVQALLKAILLRRTKEELIKNGEMDTLPSKTVHQFDVTMNRDERKVYNRFMAYSQTIFASFLQQQDSKNDNFTYDQNRLQKMYRKFQKNHRVDREIKAHEILTLLLRLRQICCHPGLTKGSIEQFEGEVEGEQQADHDPDESVGLMQEFEKLNLNASDDEDEDNRKSSSDDVFDLEIASSKVQRMMDVFRDHVKGTEDKVIIVSQWTGYLRVIRQMLESEDVKFCELNGTVPVKYRNDIVVKFNDEKSGVQVMLLSLTAGGVGLNLVGANYLFFMDLHWNPQLEQQAQDRIYRYGQKKDVKIFKFVCQDSIEHHILQVQEKKLKSAENALTGKTVTGSKLTMEDLKTLFGFQP